MNIEDCLGRVRSARAGISVVEKGLLHPSAEFWERCSRELDDAAGAIADVERELSRSERLDLDLRASLREEMAAVKRDLKRVNVLMQAAAAHYRGWAQCIGIDLASYASDGRVVAFRAPAQLSVQG